MIHTFECSSCGFKKEEDLRLKELDTHEEYCKGCNSSEPMKRVIVKTNFILKGSGWFKDGYSSQKKE